MVTHDDGPVLVDAFPGLVIDGMLVGIHHQHIPTDQAVVAETDLLGTDDSALRRDVEKVTQLQPPSHGDLRAMADGGSALEIHFTTYLPDASGAFAVIMPHIAKPDLDACRVRILGDGYLPVKLSQIDPSRYHYGTFDRRLEREIVQVEA